MWTRQALERVSTLGLDGGNARVCVGLCNFDGGWWGVGTVLCGCWALLSVVSATLFCCTLCTERTVNRTPFRTRSYCVKSPDPIMFTKHMILVRLIQCC